MYVFVPIKAPFNFLPWDSLVPVAKTKLIDDSEILLVVLMIGWLREGKQLVVSHNLSAIDGKEEWTNLASSRDSSLWRGRAIGWWFGTIRRRFIHVFVAWEDHSQRKPASLLILAKVKSLLICVIFTLPWERELCQKSAIYSCFLFWAGVRGRHWIGWRDKTPAA